MSPARTGGCRGRTRRRGAPGAVNSRSTRDRSSGSVTLRFAGSPGIAWTEMVQASSRAASSVKSGGRSGGNRFQASSSRRRRAPWGVCAAASPARSTVSTMRSPSTRLSVSATGCTGIAAAVGYHGVDDPVHERGRDHRACAVVDQHRAVAARRVHAIEVADPGGDRGLARGAAGNDLAARRQPCGRGDGGKAIGRHDQHDPIDPARGRDRRHGPGEQRAPADEGRELVDPAHPARRPRAHDHRVGPLACVGSRRSRHRPSRPRAIVSRDAAGRRSSGRRPSGAPGSR